MTYIDSRGKTLESVTYSEALRKMHSIGDGNQIDEHDIAGEDALEEQQKWQQMALDTLREFVDQNDAAIDAIDPEPAARKQVERSLWQADRDMDPTDPLNAIKIVFDMAMHGQLDPDGIDATEMEEEIDEQQRALDMTIDLLGLHSDKVNSIGSAFRI